MVASDAGLSEVAGLSTEWLLFRELGHQGAARVLFFFFFLDFCFLNSDLGSQGCFLLVDFYCDSICWLGDCL